MKFKEQKNPRFISTKLEEASYQPLKTIIVILIMLKNIFHKLKPRKNSYSLSNILTKLYEMNLHFQGKMMKYIICESLIGLFLDKLNLLMQNMMQ